MEKNEVIIQSLVIACLNAGQGMIEECGRVIPFGAFADIGSGDVKIVCYRDSNPQAEWADLIGITVDELSKKIAGKQCVVAVGSTLENESGMALGLQVETAESAKLFVYPFQVNGDLVTIDEPIAVDQLIAPRVLGNV